MKVKKADLRKKLTESMTRVSESPELAKDVQVVAACKSTRRYLDTGNKKYLADAMIALMESMARDEAREWNSRGKKI